MRSRNSRHGPAANQLDLLSFRAAFRLVRFVFGEGPGGCGGIFPCGQQADARVRKRRREGNARAAQGMARVERRYTIQTCDPSVSRTAVRWGPRFSSSAPPQIPAPSFDHFPFGPRPCLYLDDDDKNCQQRNYSCMITRLACLTILRNVKTSEISLTNQ